MAEAMTPGDEDDDRERSKRQRCGDEAGDSADAATSSYTLDGPGDEDYFGAYDSLSVHALMLSDEPRVGVYLAAIKANLESIQDKVVLDVGAGSGILSMLAAKHGAAARVYAVEAVPGMASLARDLVLRNGLQDRVTVIQGRIEDVELPEKVDVIISEWMGFYLVHESMLESVLVARDRWLKPGGVMMPSSARIWAAPVEVEPLRREIERYSNLHGLDLSPVGEAELARRLREPQVETIEAHRLLAAPVLAVDLGDLHSLKCGGTAEFSSQVSFFTLRAGHAAGIAFWFDVGFGKLSTDKNVVKLNTDPGSPPTHWQQTVVYLGVFAPVEAGEELSALVKLKQSEENPRQYDITVYT
ncbi:unnamed protein product [Polarella glacialis]|uniref:Uncharacterized protein n=1 Tax=Polarella glacialis TaxID=89957 RepID=A0A813L4X0_POLGL|nr:unnamed protein product [Polarella glacialis]CAE8719836.1 unnamed protein product [Polarella glacialis]